MKSERIKIKKIFKSKRNTKYGPKDTFVLYDARGFGFTGWGTGDDYQEGQTTEITYQDENPYISPKDGTKYFKLIQLKPEGNPAPKKQETSSADIKKIIDLLQNISDGVMGLRMDLLKNQKDDNE